MLKLQQFFKINWAICKVNTFKFIEIAFNFLLTISAKKRHVVKKIFYVLQKKSNKKLVSFAFFFK